VDDKLCRLCGTCVESCGFNAIKKGRDSIYIIKENCTGCGECMGACKYGAIKPRFFGGSRKLQVAFFITLHGFPAATTFWGMSFITTLPAPIHTSFPISMGRPYSSPLILAS